MIIQKPTITDFTNATHNHAAAASGANLPQSSITSLTSDLGLKVPYVGATNTLYMGVHDIEASRIQAAGSMYMGVGFVGTGPSDANFNNVCTAGDDCTIDVKIDAAGAMKTITLNAGGTGYNGPFTGTFTQGGGSGGSITCTVSGGAVIGVTINLMGTGYVTGTALSIIGGTGSNAKFNITAIQDVIAWRVNDEDYVNGFSYNKTWYYFTTSLTPIELKSNLRNHFGFTVWFDTLLGHHNGDTWTKTVTVSDVIVGKDALENDVYIMRNSGEIISKLGLQQVIQVDSFYMESVPDGVRYFVFQPTGNGAFSWNCYLPDPGKYRSRYQYQEIWVICRTVTNEQNLTLNIWNDNTLLSGGGRIISPGCAIRGNKLILTSGGAVGLVSTLYDRGSGSYKWCWQVTMATPLSPT